MEVEYQEDKVRFYRVYLTSDGKEVKKENVDELNHNGKVFVRIIGNGQPDEYVNEATIENIFESVIVSVVV